MAESHIVRSIYIHAPFCRRRCPYCDYAVTILPDDATVQATSRWQAAIRAEWERVRTHEALELRPLETLYVGGGTPSLLGARAMAGIRALLGDRLLGAPELEWTAEANPEDLAPALAASWRAAGVNRVSIGVQSFQEGALRWLERPHAADDSVRAIEAARGAGIENINIDLAFGLPERVDHAFESELSRALELRPPHVTLQEISVEPGTPLASRVQAGEVCMPPETAVHEAYRLASRTLRTAGYVHYEVSSFALPGRESRHAWAYLSGVPYIGLGNAAHTCLPPRRRWNLADWGGYCRSAQSDTLSENSTVEGEERLTAPQARLESLWLRLRTRRGLDREALSPEAGALVERWIHQGFAEGDPGIVRLTAEGWLRLDRLVVELERTFPA